MAQEPSAFISPKIALREKSIAEKGVFARADIKTGEIVVDIIARVVHAPGKYTLQISSRRYLYADYVDNYINHSCDPNLRILLFSDPRRMAYVAMRAIRKGEELFWNYNTTDWHLEPHFVCRCGSACCAGVIAGAPYVSAKDRKRLRAIATPFIRAKWDSTKKIPPCECGVCRTADS